MNYTHVLYHAQCTDGFGAAWAAWKALKETAKYIPIHHGEPFPALPTDADVIMLDAAYPRPRHEELKTLVRSLTVVDHHKTNLETIGKLPNVHIDLSHSGATLAWLFFHPGEPIPELLKYVEDYDLWRFNLPSSLEIHAAIESYSYDFDVWCGLEQKIGTERFRADGEAILRYQKGVVENACKSVFWMTMAGHRIPVVNATELTSEIGNRLCKLYPEAPFSAYYYEKENIRCWGLRSIGDFDVTNIVKIYGGGGHKNAAGFTEPIERKRTW
jgi:uncharacterized protein